MKKKTKAGLTGIKYFIDANGYHLLSTRFREDKNFIEFEFLKEPIILERYGKVKSIKESWKNGFKSIMVEYDINNIVKIPKRDLIPFDNKNKFVTIKKYFILKPLRAYLK